jgi:hypothetical protein
MKIVFSRLRASGRSAYRPVFVIEMDPVKVTDSLIVDERRYRTLRNREHVFLLTGCHSGPIVLFRMTYSRGLAAKRAVLQPWVTYEDIDGAMKTCLDIPPST